MSTPSSTLVAGVSRLTRLVAYLGLTTTSLARMQESIDLVIPRPRHVEPTIAARLAWSGRVVATDAALHGIARGACEDLSTLCGRPGTVEPTPGEGDLVLRLDDARQGEAHRVVIDAGAATVYGAAPEAIAMGIATLLQLMDDAGSWPRTAIDDAPTFAWRLLMLDVARRHHTVDEIEQVIALSRFYKLRQVQLHLTDDQNFMFPSAHFGKLGADNGSGKRPYTRDELGELVRYAQDRGVELIPELDVPGHSTLLHAAHPEAFAKKNGSLDVDDPTTVASVCALVDEFADVFPATSIHVGCDESGVGPKKLGAFITTLHDHLTQRGRKTLVWEGFGRGAELPADVMVLIWNRDRAPQELLARHHCLNGMWDPCYVVEHYPLDNLTYAPPERVYAWQPTEFRRFTNDGEREPVADAKNVAGGFLCWWEGHGRNALPLLRRRAAALAARLWNLHGENDAPAFERRLDRLDARLDALLFPVDVTFESDTHTSPTEFPGTRGVSFARVFRGTTTVRASARARGEIRAAVDDGAFAPIDDNRVRVDKTTRLELGLFADDVMIGRPRPVLLRRIDPSDPDTNVALGKPVTTDAAPDPLHPEAILTDGNRERMAQYLRYPLPVTLTIDLEAEAQVSTIQVFTFHGGDDRERYVLETSTDAATWTLVHDSRDAGPAATADGDTHRFAPRKARYVRITAYGNTRLPGTMCRLVEVEVR